MSHDRAGSAGHGDRQSDVLEQQTLSDGAPLSMTKVVDEISANRPILTGIAWAAGGGHAQVIYGFDVDAGTITYGDPWPSSRRSVTQAIDSYTQNADWVWFGEDYGIAAR